VLGKETFSFQRCWKLLGSIDPVTRTLPSRGLSATRVLRRYFRSGWAFLIPYLAAYLLYYWLKWPVNPVVSEGGVKVASLPSVASAMEGESGAWVPCLLHVYWTLHAINVILAAVALVSWWRDRCQETGVRSQELGDGCQIPDLGDLNPAPSSRLKALSSAASAAVPWLLLGLLFWIPGVYLEWPADPWEHVRRINEWSPLQTVGEHTAWAKSSYFLAYSLLGRIAPPTRQLFWLDFYYTGACLLLCWQYYRLARAVGLGERASFIFVLVQALTFGNNIFGFYRYYGISSSIFAQLGAVALVRVAIEYANQKFQVPRSKFQEPTTGILQEETEAAEGIVTAQPGTPTAHERIACEQAPIAPLSPLPHVKRLGSLPPRFPGFPLSAFPAALCAACLLALTAFNHVQGLGIAGLGVLAVIVWRLIEWKRSMVFWLAAAAIALSIAAIVWWPRNPALDANYRPAGWLSYWYGFNVFDPRSLAGERTLAILGIFGIVNLFAGLFLLRRNHLVAWLTLTPLLVLSLPVVAIPFAGVLAGRNVDEILTFHRMLLAIPGGLAIVCFGAGIANHKFQVSSFKFQGSASLSSLPPVKTDIPSAREEIACKQAHPARRSALPVIRFPGFPLSRFASLPRFPFSAFPLFLFSLAALLLVPANGPFYNRFWQALMVPPDDLMMKPIVLAVDSAAFRLRGVEHLRLVATATVANVLGTILPRHFPHSDRRIGRPIVESLNNVVAIPRSNRPTIDPKYRTLTRDPLAANPSAWTTLDGSPPEFITGIKDLSESLTALQNPSGRRSDAFTSDLISIDPAQHYCVEFNARQTAGTNATAYLAVAWYDERGHLLESYAPAPRGAGSPVGWVNGTYSYFGLVGTLAPTTWTICRRSFGLHETAAIPPHARFVRVGALLNYNATPAATIQLTNVRLWRKSEAEMMADGTFSINEHLFIIAPSGRVVWTYASQAAQASHHWPANQVASDLAGGAELTIAARVSGDTPVESGSVIFDLNENAESDTLKR
jgi:hypothetical protein